MVQKRLSFLEFIHYQHTHVRNCNIRLVKEFAIKSADKCARLHYFLLVRLAEPFRKQHYTWQRNKNSATRRWNISTVSLSAQTNSVSQSLSSSGGDDTTTDIAFHVCHS